MWKARKALLVLASTPTLIWGQAPDVDWSFNYGGSDVETSHWIEPTSDGGYIVGAKTRSFDGDITHNNGVEDVWILKLRQDGTLDWQQCYGGSGAEGTLCKAREMEDGGYIVMGGLRHPRTGMWTA